MSKQNKTINFLYNASTILPSNELYTAIRSRMLTKCDGINSTSSLKLDLIARCDACGVVFKNVPPTHFIRSVKRPKCYKNIENGVKNNTKYQILCGKKFKKYKNDKQILITQCKLCKNQIKTPIKKVGHTKTLKNQINPFDEIINRKKLKNMQRKKNREFSGLKKSAVLSVKRSLETEDNNKYRSSKKLKTFTDVNLVTPVSKKTNLKRNILTPNTLNTKLNDTSTSSFRDDHLNDSDVICLDSSQNQMKEFKNLNDMFTPKSVQNKTIIEISDNEVPQSSSKNKNKNKKNKKKNKNMKNQFVPKIEQTRKIKNNDNVVLVAEQTVADKKKKKLNSLSNFLNKSASMQNSNKNNSLQNFLSTFT